MKLSDLTRENAQYILDSRGECEVLTPFMDSRKKVEKGLFFCISGARFDAHTFAEQAVANGANALVVERFLPIDVPQVLVSSTRKAFGPMSAALCGHPARKMKMIGITGTKGKTTTSYLLKSILESAGMKVGLIGTTGNMIGSTFIHGNMTTPEADELQRLLKHMADENVNAVVMEVSAHATAMHRIDGICYDVGCYTNLSQDHLDYFETMEKYFEAKKVFFTPEYVKAAVLNVDDETTEKIIADAVIPCTRFGICTNADVFARDIEISENGVSFRMRTKDKQERDVKLKLTGIFNVYNALTAASAALEIGVSPDDVVRGLENVRAVPGRAEMLDTDMPYKVLLDYSHSPDALENILKAARDFTRGRVIVLFGCGGDRDHGKRPMMGEIGGKMADYCILTSDNPRSEDPFEILAAIEEGVRPTGGKYTVIENRREAIRHALEIAEEGDIVILAGKGHETYQEIKGVKNHFDEKEVVQELLRDMK